jgi:hypothetical protein
MRHLLFSLAAATALFASVGAAAAKDPVKLTDGQLDRATAGDTVNSTNETAYLLGLSETELSRQLAIASFATSWLNGVPQGLTATP